MDYSSFAAILVSRRTLRWLILVSTIAACMIVFVDVLRIRREDPAQQQEREGVLTLHHFRTSSHSGGRLRLRVSGDVLTVSHMHLFGPLRLGFAYSLTVRNLVVETFPNTKTGPPSSPPSFNEVAASLVPSLKRDLVSLVTQQIGGPIVSAEFGPLKIIQHTEAQERVLFEAAECHTAKKFAQFICTDGTVLMNGNKVPFRKWQHDSAGTTRSLQYRSSGSCPDRGPPTKPCAEWEERNCALS